jgi:hypothetical protein
MYPSNGVNYTTVAVANPLDHSTGGLNTGIGFETLDAGYLGGAIPGLGKTGLDTANLIVTTGGTTKGIPAGGPGAINGFTDDYQPGISLPSGASIANTVIPSGIYGAVLTAIGGGKSTANTVAAPSVAAPYNLQPLLDMGVGGSRDAGAGPAFTGFGMKFVTAATNIAQGAVIETGFINRTTAVASGLSLISGMSALGSATAASPVVT